MIKEGAKSIVKGLYALSTIGMDTGFHMVRYRMYQRIGEIMSELDDVGREALSISHSDALCDLIDKPVNVTEANFPEHNILDLGFEDDGFDYVVSDQVFEHIKGSPQQAMDETYRVLKPGGPLCQDRCRVHFSV